MTSSQGQTSEPSIVRTARWVALAMLSIAVVACAALWLSWRDFQYAEDTRNALTGTVHTIRQNSDEALVSLQRQLKEAEDRNRDLQGEVKVLTTRLQLMQDDVELARRQARLVNQNQAEQGIRLPAKTQPQVAIRGHGEDVKTAGGELVMPTNETPERAKD